MKEDKLFRAIGLVDEELVEEANIPSIEGGRASIDGRKDSVMPERAGKRDWRKYVALAAGLVLLLSAINMWPQTEKPQTDVANKDTQPTTQMQMTTEVQQPESQTTTELQQPENESQTTEKPLMNFAIAFDGMGYEGIMGYEMPSRGNPWKETDEIETLPIFKNDTVYVRADGGIATDWLPKERYEQMESRLLEVMTFFGMEGCEIDRNLTECVASNEAMEISIDGDMHLRIEFLEAVVLPNDYNVTTSATVDETRKVAEYVLSEYGELFDMENPKISVTESDYNFYGERYHHDVYFYEEGESAKETLLNYKFDYASYSLNDDGGLWFIDIVHRDWGVIGEYEVISLAEAKEKLLRGEYDTSYCGDGVPREENIREIELTYYISWMDDYKPYYKFWVETPEEKRENGLNTYVAYYVPAIEGAYVEITFN